MPTRHRTEAAVWMLRVTFPMAPILMCVPMDRTHVIGHSEVPDPNNPGLYGGSDHHTDPGPNWDAMGAGGVWRRLVEALGVEESAP